MTGLRKSLRRIIRDDRGVAAVEMAFAFPILMIMLWMIIQLGLVFRAVSGMQHALGEGARYATIYPRPTDTQITQRIQDKVYGSGPGTFTVSSPVSGTGFVTLQVSYSQPTSLLFLPGPTVSLTRSKKVWIAD